MRRPAITRRQATAYAIRGVGHMDGLVPPCPAEITPIATQGLAITPAVRASAGVILVATPHGATAILRRIRASATAIFSAGIIPAYAVPTPYRRTAKAIIVLPLCHTSPIRSSRGRP